MAKLLMISGDTALASGKKGAFYNTMEEFHKYWDRIDIICPHLGKNNQIANYFENVHFHPSPWPVLWQSFWIYKKGLTLLKEEKSHVMTVHDYPPFYNGLGAMALNIKTNVPYLEELYHIVGYPKAASIKESVYRAMTFFAARLITSRAKKVRVMNKIQVPHFLKKAGVSARKLEYIPAIYLDKDIFKDMKTTKTFDVIFVGRIVENKGINILLEATKNTSLKVLVVGDGPLREKLKAESSKLGVDVTFYGFARDHQEIAQLINKSKILVMPSYNEGGPRVIIEAMACGTPVLATPVGLVLDLVKEQYPIFLGSWDPAELKEKLHKLLSDQALYDLAVIKGKELTQDFNKESSIRYYAEKIKDLI